MKGYLSILLLVVMTLMFGCLEPTITEEDVWDCNAGVYAPNKDQFTTGADIATIELSGWKEPSLEKYKYTDVEKVCFVKTTFSEEQMVLGTKVKGRICTFEKTYCYNVEEHNYNCNEEQLAEHEQMRREMGLETWIEDCQVFN